MYQNASIFKNVSFIMLLHVPFIVQFLQGLYCFYFDVHLQEICYLHLVVSLGDVYVTNLSPWHFIKAWLTASGITFDETKSE